MNGWFDQLVERIKSFDSDRGVEILRKLLWAEAWSIKIPHSRIQITSSNDRSDGGIDARVDERAKADGNVILSGQTRHQIKTGKGFKPWQKSCLQKELFALPKGKSGKSKPKAKLGKETLKPGIRNCLDVGGTYVLICCGHDLEDTSEAAPQTNLRMNLLAAKRRAGSVCVWLHEYVAYLETRLEDELVHEERES